MRAKEVIDNLDLDLVPVDDEAGLFEDDIDQDIFHSGDDIIEYHIKSNVNENRFKKPSKTKSLDDYWK